MIGRLVAGLIVVGLAVGIWALWPRENSDPSSTTVPTAVETTTTTLAPTVTTTTPTTSTTADTHVVATVEEAEEILQALWFGWFEGIYNQDEDRIREVVGEESAVDDARAQFGVMEFQREPRPGDILTSDTEILRTDDQCLAVWTNLGITGFSSGASNGVHVLRWTGEKWVALSLWEFRNDLWEDDCRFALEPLS
jgi:hypothetical protein